MADAKSKTFREFITFCNALPRGRRITAYVSTIGFFVFLVALALAAYFKTGFLSYLLLTFLVFRSTMHSNYALDTNLTQRKVRKIDYWYVGAAAVGLLLFAVGYSQQRDLVVTKLFVAAHRAGEEAVREKVNSSLTDLSKWLCNAKRSSDFQAACDGTKRIAPEIKPHLMADQIKALTKKYENLVIIPYGRAFDIEQLKAHPEYFTPVVIVIMALDDWEKYMRDVPPQSASPRDEEAEILFGLGQFVVWPFFLAYALALRITKVKRTHHQRHRKAARGVQAADQDANRIAVGRHSRNVVLGIARFRPDQHAQSGWLADARHRANRSAD